MRVSEVGFDSVGARLDGTLWSPDDPVAAPAVVLVGGSGPTNRTNGGYFDRLREALLCAGVVVLGYDKRGVGDSTGEWASATVDELAADACAAMRMVAAEAGVDRERVGLFGHSEGGWVALRACAMDRCRFLILNGCPAVSFVDAEIYALATAGVDHGRATELYDKLRSAAHAGDDINTANRVLADAEDPQLREVLDHAGFALDRDRWMQLRSWIDYTPGPDLQRLTAPALVVYGDADPLTPIQASLAALTRSAPSARTQLFTGGDHRVQIDGNPAPGYLETITSWCLNLHPDPVRRDALSDRQLVCVASGPGRTSAKHSFHNDVVSADSYADLLERLFGAYEDRHTIPAIELIVSESRAQLEGQIPPGAHLELLERLVRQRLEDLPPTRPSR